MADESNAAAADRFFIHLTYVVHDPASLFFSFLIHAAAAAAAGDRREWLGISVYETAGTQTRDLFDRRCFRGKKLLPSPPLSRYVFLPLHDSTTSNVRISHQCINY